MTTREDVKVAEAFAAQQRRALAASICANCGRARASHDPAICAAFVPAAAASPAYSKREA